MLHCACTHQAVTPPEEPARARRPDGRQRGEDAGGEGVTKLRRHGIFAALVVEDQRGDCAVALDEEVVKGHCGLDQQGVKSMVIPYKERLDVLLAPTQPADAESSSAA